LKSSIREREVKSNAERARALETARDRGDGRARDVRVAEPARGAAARERDGAGG
jgi:hypothetical protein